MTGNENDHPKLNFPVVCTHHFSPDILSSMKFSGLYAQQTTNKRLSPLEQKPCQCSEIPAEASVFTPKVRTSQVHMRVHTSSGTGTPFAFKPESKIHKTISLGFSLATIHPYTGRVTGQGRG